MVDHVPLAREPDDVYDKSQPNAHGVATQEAKEEAARLFIVRALARGALRDALGPRPGGTPEEPVIGGANSSRNWWRRADS